ncbi:uncharacterized protein B0T23DRAFT_384007 [Neurospora hispaniola]|uniref:Uncharacterized protein n=1 Tax=Neurospora hispaniola TaxID=588809 RepID=A0AAJ0MP21_9PEZI|nr:hypothetical protein B0T23DRAFT_384007 [Neurospora hispaniola]
MPSSYPPESTHSHAFAVAKTSTANQLSLFLSQCTNNIAQPEFGCQSTQQNSCQVETPTQNMQVFTKKLKLFRNRKEPKRSTKTRKTDPLRGETSFECHISHHPISVCTYFTTSSTSSLPEILGCLSIGRPTQDLPASFHDRYIYYVMMPKTRTTGLPNRLTRYVPSTTLLCRAYKQFLAYSSSALCSIFHLSMCILFILRGLISGFLVPTKPTPRL